MFLKWNLSIENIVPSFRKEQEKCNKQDLFDSDQDPPNLSTIGHKQDLMEQ